MPVASRTSSGFHISDILDLPEAKPTATDDSHGKFNPILHKYFFIHQQLQGFNLQVHSRFFQTPSKRLNYLETIKENLQFFQELITTVLNFFTFFCQLFNSYYKISNYVTYVQLKISIIEYTQLLLLFFFFKNFCLMNK